MSHVPTFIRRGFAMNRKAIICVVSVHLKIRLRHALNSRLFEASFVATFAISGGATCMATMAIAFLHALWPLIHMAIALF